MYWVARGTQPKEVRDLISQQDGRSITRRGASIFLGELLAKTSRYLAYPSGDDPDLVMAETKEAIRANDIVSFRDLMKRVAKSIEVLWQETWDGVNPETAGNDQSPAYVDSLQARVNLLTAAGMTAIESDKPEWLDYVFDSLERVSRMGMRTLRDNWGASPQKPRDIAQVPTATLLFPYVGLIALALKGGNPGSIGRLMKLEFEEDDGSSELVVSNGFITYPRALPHKGISPWDHVIHQWQLCEWLEDFFVNREEYERYVYQVSFLISLVCVTKEPKQSGGAQYMPFQFFRLPPRDEGMSPLTVFSR